MSETKYDIFEKARRYYYGSLSEFEAAVASDTAEMIVKLLIENGMDDEEADDKAWDMIAVIRNESGF